MTRDIWQSADLWQFNAFINVMSKRHTKQSPLSLLKIMRVSCWFRMREEKSSRHITGSWYPKGVLQNSRRAPRPFLYESSPGVNPALIPLIHTDNWQMHYWRFHPPGGSDFEPRKWHMIRGWNWTCQLPFTLPIIPGRTFMFKNCLLLFSYYT